MLSMAKSDQDKSMPVRRPSSSFIPDEAPSARRTLRSQSEEDETAYLAAKARQVLSQAKSENIPTQIRIKNRRRRYLGLHPEYFGPHLELADPLLYDRLIRRFQTSAEREAEGRKKGYSGVLEADLYRGEAKLHALKHPDPNATISYRRGRDGEILAEEKDEVPENKEEGYKRWKGEMERRFVEGRDDDFGDERYEGVDEDERLDGEEVERERMEEWFEGESPGWVVRAGEEEVVVKGEEKTELKGETGVQDY